MSIVSFGRETENGWFSFLATPITKQKPNGHVVPCPFTYNTTDLWIVTCIYYPVKMWNRFRATETKALSVRQWGSDDFSIELLCCGLHVLTPKSVKLFFETMSNQKKENVSLLDLRTASEQSLYSSPSHLLLWLSAIQQCQCRNTIKTVSAARHDLSGGGGE